MSSLILVALLRPARGAVPIAPISPPLRSQTTKPSFIRPGTRLGETVVRRSTCALASSTLSPARAARRGLTWSERLLPLPGTPIGRPSGLTLFPWPVLPAGICFGGVQWPSDPHCLCRSQPRRSANHFERDQPGIPCCLSCSPRFRRRGGLNVRICALAVRISHRSRCLSSPFLRTRTDPRCLHSSPFQKVPTRPRCSPRSRRPGICTAHLHQEQQR